jgi:hypothetical membrane protein
MRVFELMDGKVIGISFAVNLVVWAVGLLIVGMHPSDTEMHVIFWTAFIAGFIVGMYIVPRATRASSSRSRT